MWSDGCSLEQIGVKNEDTLKLVITLVMCFSFHLFIRLFVLFLLSYCCLRIVRGSIFAFARYITSWGDAHEIVWKVCLIHIVCKFKFELVNHNFLNFLNYSTNIIILIHLNLSKLDLIYFELDLI